MDSPFALGGFLYTPLYDLNASARSASSIASWPSFNSSVEYLHSQQQQHQIQQQQSIISPEFNIQVENALLSSTSFSSSSTSSFSSVPSTACHSLDTPQGSTNDINVAKSSILHSSSMSSLSPYYSLMLSSDMTRSSSISSMDCIEPAALTLNGNQGSSTYSLSPVLPSQDSRRDSVCSLTMGDYDDEHMRVMFERNLAISIPPLPMAVCTSSEHSTTSQAFVQDFVMPDGTIYRFDGTDLVPVPSTHFSNLTSLEETSPVVPSMPKFSNNAFFHQTLMSLAAPEVSMTMYCSELAQPAPEKPARRVNSRILRTGPAKKSSLRKSPLVRRGSADSAYSSSSSSSASQSRQQTTSHSSDASTQNDNTSNSKYRKEGAGEYQCPFENCTYRYNLRRELNRHRNVHLFAGKDKYRCMNCNSGLCRLDSVKRHMEAKGKSECLKMGLYQEFRDNGELVKVRKCKATWYEAAAANAAAGGYGKV